ncbi:MAG: enoyl-CoA hydratase/isomerase family protein [Chloroflexota bacterium]|jgi:enoyl-CoA hydratase/carnithine racemase
MSELVQTLQRGSIFEIVLNRPEKRNAINLDLYDALGRAIAEAGQTIGVRTVFVRGQGKVFSSGIDLTTFLLLPDKYGPNWQQRMRQVTADFQEVLNRLERLEVPTIALLHGHCLGLALEIALACDMRIAAEGTVMGLLETRLGIIPDVGGTTRLTRLVGPARSKELIFTARQFDAAEGERWGLVNHVVVAGQLMAKAEEIASEIEASAPLAVGLAKRVIDGIVDLNRGLALEGWAQSQLVNSKDFTEAVQAL